MAHRRAAAHRCAAPRLQGVPPELRPAVWLELSSANERRQRHQPAYYADAAMKGAESQYAHQIELVGGAGRGRWVLGAGPRGLA